MRITLATETLLGEQHRFDEPVRTERRITDEDRAKATAQMTELVTDIQRELASRYPALADLQWRVPDNEGALFTGLTLTETNRQLGLSDFTAFAKQTLATPDHTRSRLTFGEAAVRYTVGEALDSTADAYEAKALRAEGATLIPRKIDAKRHADGKIMLAVVYDVQLPARQG